MIVLSETVLSETVLSETVLVLDGCSNLGDAEYEYEKKHEQSIVGRGRSGTGY